MRQRNAQQEMEQLIEDYYVDCIRVADQMYSWLDPKELKNSKINKVAKKHRRRKYQKQHNHLKD